MYSSPAIHSSQPMLSGQPVPSPPPQGVYHGRAYSTHTPTVVTNAFTSLFDCGSDINSFIDSFFCPYCQLQRQINKLTAKDEATFHNPPWYGLACGAAMTLDAALIAVMFVVLHGAAEMTAFGYLLFNIVTRSKVRAYFGIVERGACEACFSICCPVCSTAQMHREMTMRGYYPGGFCTSRPSCSHPLYGPAQQLAMVGVYAITPPYAVQGVVLPHGHPMSPNSVPPGTNNDEYPVYRPGGQPAGYIPPAVRPAGQPNTGYPSQMSNTPQAAPPQAYSTTNRIPQPVYSPVQPPPNNSGGAYIQMGQMSPVTPPRQPATQYGPYNASIATNPSGRMDGYSATSPHTAPPPPTNFPSAAGPSFAGSSNKSGSEPSPKTAAPLPPPTKCPLPASAAPQPAAVPSRGGKAPKKDKDPNRVGGHDVNRAGAAPQPAAAATQDDDDEIILDDSGDGGDGDLLGDRPSGTSKRKKERSRPDLL